MDKTFDELLKPVRDDIDRIDSQLLPLFLERMECSRRVAEIKEAHAIPVLNVKREQEILDKVREKAGSELGDSAAALYSAIMAISRESQHKLLAGDDTLCSIVRNAPSTIETAGKKIICQGVSGAYSDKAASTFFGGAANISFCPQFADVFSAIQAGEAEYGVVPMENSAAGSVSEVYGLIMKYKYYIVGAVNVFVNHCLCAKKGSVIKRVVSHPQALLQCAEYIRANSFEKEEYSNTAAAAKAVAMSEDYSEAAICSMEAAEKYGLQIIEHGIQDSKTNHTRFAVISKTAVFPTDAGKISLCFSIPHITGSLYRTLERFSLNGLNLTKIESRPIRDKNFEYEFYLDFAGNIHNGNILSLICSLGRELESFSFLGNYSEIL